MRLWTSRAYALSRNGWTLAYFRADRGWVRARELILDEPPEDITELLRSLMQPGDPPLSEQAKAELYDLRVSPDGRKARARLVGTKWKP